MPNLPQLRWRAFLQAGKVYIWHLETGKLLVKNEGHSASVNCVAWNPKNKHMLASASDDKTISIWVSPYSLGRKEYIPVAEDLPQNPRLEDVIEQSRATRGSLARSIGTIEDIENHPDSRRYWHPRF